MSIETGENAVYPTKFEEKLSSVIKNIRKNSAFISYDQFAPIDSIDFSHIIKSWTKTLQQLSSIDTSLSIEETITVPENILASTMPEHMLAFGTVNETKEKTEEAGQELDNLFDTSGELTFEEGLGNKFYEKLETIVLKHEKNAILALYARTLNGKQVDPEVASETLNWLGSIDGLDVETHCLRLWLLGEGLKHSSPWVREGAAEGISRLNDPKAIPSLEAAVEKERGRLLKGEMKNIIARLSRTRDAATAKMDIRSI
jgi:hypothetical protein